MREAEGGTVVVNGTARDFEPGTTVADLVSEIVGDANAKGVAAALNGAVVPRGRWRLLELTDGDRVEILTAVQGG
ncbi:sulfur carrier protein ThiS [Sporichthya brevicatena]|uniref:Sulfur carrier protein ThiS n=1 Tax=Sporichthya brevicatena TaxID=171442 RepID=A0ABN1GZP3_9ACTN